MTMQFYSRVKKLIMGGKKKVSQGGEIAYEKYLNLFKAIQKLVRQDFWAVLQTILLIALAAGLGLFAKYVYEKIEAITQVTVIEHPKVEDVIKQDEIINQILEDVKEETGADRAYLFQFHNGRSSLVNIPFIYMSNTHEVTRRGVSAEIQHLQALPISMSSNLLNKLYEEKGLCLDINDVEDESTREILERQNINSLCLYGIFSNGKLQGFVGIDYVISTPKVWNQVSISLVSGTRQVEDVLYK